MNSINDSHPDFNKEVLVKLDNGLYVVGQFHHIEMSGYNRDYFTVGKGISGNDPHMTGKPIEWCYLPS